MFAIKSSIWNKWLTSQIEHDIWMKLRVWISNPFKLVFPWFSPLETVNTMDV